MKLQLRFLLGLFFLLPVYFLHAQRIHCNMVELPFASMVAESNTIVRARVVDSQSRWNSEATMIYTYTQLQILETFKGQVVNEVMLVTEGGRAQGMTVEFQDRFELMKDEELVIFLEKIPAHWSVDPIAGVTSFAPYASLQGVFRIPQGTDEVKDVFARFSSLSEMRGRIHKITGKRSKKNAGSDNPLPQPPQPQGLAAISSITPTVSAAGVGNVLTINGSGFGATRGSGFVEFTISDGTFGTPKAKDYVSWNDTQIQVRIPSTFSNTLEPAATGIVRVTPSGGTAASSAGTLTILYANFQKINTALDSAVTMRMVNANNAGGYTLQYNDQFQTLSSLAKQTMERAMNTWKCATNVNWAISATSTTIRATGPDGVNVITDDVLQPLPAGVLGRGLNFIADCVNGQIVRALTLQMDVIVADIPGSFTWFFGTGNPSALQIDFETVFLHEFGHLHQLHHTRAGGSEVMVPSISAGTTRRNLHQNDSDGALNNMALSTAAAVCNPTQHIPVSGTVSISTASTFPVCSSSSVIFNATFSNLTSNTTLEWLRNGVVSGTGNSFTLTNPVNNEVVRARLANCSSIISNSITVTTQVNAATIAYSGPFCKTLTTNQNPVITGTTGGSFSSSPAGLSLNATSGAILPSTSTAGSYTVTYSLAATSVCPASSATTSVAITAAPSAAFNYTGGNFCKSNTLAVNPTITGSSGGSYAASPAGLSLNASTGAIVPSLSTAGTYTVTRTIAASGGCQAVSSTASVTIIAQLATPGNISGTPTNTCGQTRTFSIAAVSGASSYQWTVPAGVSGSSTTTSITLTFPNNFSSGILKVRALAANGCHSLERTLNLTGPPAAPGTITITNINTVNYTANASITAVSGATFYSWTGNGVTILSGQGTTSVSVVATANPATLCVRAVNACGNSPSSCKTVSFFSGGSGQQSAEYTEGGADGEKSEIQLSPNPAQDEVVLLLGEDWDQKQVRFAILDMEGRLIREGGFVYQSGVRIPIQVNELATGLYMIHVMSGDKTAALRLMKD